MRGIIIFILVTVVVDVVVIIIIIVVVIVIVVPPSRGRTTSVLTFPAGFCDACDLVVTKRQTDRRGKKTEKNIYMYLPRRSIYSEEGGSNIFIFRRTSSVDVYVTLAVFVNHRCH